MMQEEGDLVLVHDCDHPERLGVWERTVANTTYQLQDYIERRKEQDRKDRRAKAIGYSAMVLVPLIVAALFG